jgi:hypothetical protein
MHDLQVLMSILAGMIFTTYIIKNSHLFTFVLGQKLALGVLVIYNTSITFVFTMEI